MTEAIDEQILEERYTERKSNKEVTQTLESVAAASTDRKDFYSKYLEENPPAKLKKEGIFDLKEIEQSILSRKKENQ